MRCSHLRVLGLPAQEVITKDFFMRQPDWPSVVKALVGYNKAVLQGLELSQSRSHMSRLVFLSQTLCKQAQHILSVYSRTLLDDLCYVHFNIKLLEEWVAPFRFEQRDDLCTVAMKEYVFLHS